MQQEELLPDPEEETEKKLVNYMAVGIIIAVAGLILILALLPWIRRYQQENKG